MAEGIDPKKKKIMVKKTINETATRQDSLDTHNSSNARNDFYRKAGYTEDAPKKFDKVKQNQNDIDEMAYKSVDFNKDKPKTNVIRNGVSTKEALKPSDYAKQIDKHKYDQRDNVTQDVNMDAPMGRKDSRMQPSATITFRKGTDIASVDQYDKPADKKQVSKPKPKIMVKVKKAVVVDNEKKEKKQGIKDNEESEVFKKGSYFSKQHKII